MCISIVLLVIVPYAAGNTTFSPLIRKTGGLGRVWVLALVALGVDLGFAVLYVPGVVRDRDYYARLTARAKEYDLSALAVFMNALDGASTKAGRGEPPIAVLDSATPNALTFAGHGKKPVVAVTRGLLGAGLSYSEAEGVMAHQLAGIMTGDYIRKPGIFSFETAAYVLLGLFSILALAAAPMVSTGSGVGGGVGFLVCAAALLLSGGFAVRRLKRGDAHDYLFADTIAAEVTGKPDALSEAIKKLDGLVNGKAGSPFPDNELGIKCLFAPPHRWSDTAAQFVKRRHGELDMNVSERMIQRQVEGVQKAMDELAAWGEELLAERLDNLAR
jgi:Zn-dependent protease with chaperone function